MPRARTYRGHLPVILYLAILLAATAFAAPENDRDAAIFEHVMAFENSGDVDPAELVREFEAERLAAAWLAQTTHEERLALLRGIQKAAALAGGAIVGENNGEIRLELMGRTPFVVLFRVQEEPPYAITALRTEAGASRLEVTWDSVGELVSGMEEKGFAGVLYVARDNETVVRDAYGLSNRALGYDTKPDTVFGIGSTPIDFTVAGVLLLAQQEKLSLDDTIDAFFDNVPADKRRLTIRHLISGQSGLPDFHHIGSDWDTDLAWIDRVEAVRRILAQPLLFAPGEGNAHSHSAYGLVAAIIERVSGQGYFEFLSAAFFEPAGMLRTGMYGDDGGLDLRAFAVGYGPSSVGVPNIPPNWGRTSWLVMGSGGMYSTLGDMLRFYRFVQSGDLLDKKHARRMGGERVAIGGSDRGFYFFYATNGRGNAAMLMTNGEGRTPEIRGLSQALESLVMSGIESR
ncbi:MAG: beta-lactamase family protein [Gammaproteobacteria bacterium]|nr:beta-lactamase family protein [Gammaproteobacteria bacterium]